MLDLELRILEAHPELPRQLKMPGCQALLRVECLQERT